MKYLFKIFLLLSSTLSFSEDSVEAKGIYLSYTDYPKRVFTNQRFNLTLKAVVLKQKNQYDKIITTFIDERNLKINKDLIWNQEKDNIFTTNIPIKIFDEKFTLPLVTVALIKDEEILDYLSINPPKITFEKIAINQELFSNVIAESLQINSIKTKQYTNNKLLTTINIEAKNSNLEDFRLESYEDQGLKDIEDEYQKQSIYYYLIIPSHKKEIKFTYYNTLVKDFKTITLNITLDEDLVSTQTELNPYNSSISIYKKSLLIFILIVFIVIYYFNQKNRYLIIMVVLISFIAYYFIPNKKIILDKEQTIYILPSKNSTIFKVMQRKELVEVINENKDFKKVLFQNKTIGWIKTNDNI
ncbi:MAG: hypothetical protein U9Q20_00335 [Campylobacterota bacterium]|nr:hypothetical protein [Campylobacterota bacterium]